MDGSGQDPGSRQEHKFETDWIDNQAKYKCQPANDGQGNRMTLCHSEEHVFHHSSYSFPPILVSSLAARVLLLRTFASCPEPSIPSRSQKKPLIDHRLCFSFYSQNIIFYVDAGLVETFHIKIGNFSQISQKVNMPAPVPFSSFRTRPPFRPSSFEKSIIRSEISSLYVVTVFYT